MENTSAGQHVAGEIRARLARTRRSQTELAEALGTSQAAVSRRLQGHVPFDVDELVRIADFLGVPASALLPDPEPVSA